MKLIVAILFTISFAYALSPPEWPTAFSASVHEVGNGTEMFFRWFYDYDNQKGKYLVFGHSKIE